MKPPVEPGELVDGDLRLVLAKYSPVNQEAKWNEDYRFDMMSDGQKVGHVGLRYEGPFSLYYQGNVGYEVEEAHRGCRYAARACRLLFPFARRLGLRELWLTVRVGNVPSERTCELIGAVPVEVVKIPDHLEMRSRMEYGKRWRVQL